MNNNIPIRRLFRVQGGIAPNRSRDMIRFNKKGEIILSFTRLIHIGDMEHMRYFVLKRLGIENITEFNEDSKNRDVHIIEMVMPYWFTYLLEKYSVRQFDSRGEKRPLLVDKTTPGGSYAIKQNWSNLLKECCLHASDTKIESPENMYSIIFSNQDYNLREIDYNKINELLIKCEISEEDIKKLHDIWELPLFGKENIIL